MQPIIVTALLLEFVFADNYPGGTSCHINLECNTNCPNGEWTITAQDGESILACTTEVTDPTQYYRSQCIRVQGPASTPVKTPDYPATARVCRYLGGVSCDRACIFSGKESAEQETHKAWDADCKKTGAVMASMMVSDSEELSKKGVGCH